MPVTDPAALRSTVIVLSIALEETLKALATQKQDQAQDQSGAWLDEVQDLALLRGKAVLLERSGGEGDATALQITEAIFAKMRAAIPGAVIDT